MNQSVKALRWAALAILATTTQAAVFNFNNTGGFDSFTELGGVPLGVDTPYSMTATFDDALIVVGGLNLFQITAFSLTIDGHGTYTGTLAANLRVYLNSGVTYDAGICLSVPSDGSFFGTFAGSLNASFDAAVPSPTVFDGYTLATGGSFNIPLVGIPGGLTISGFDNTPMTASITAVPEPSEYAAVTGLALGVFALVQRRKQARNGTAYTPPHGKEGLGLGAARLWRGCSGSGSAGSVEGSVPI